ncbi:MAG: Maf family protein [Steroidobacteraceae bacterium]
MTRPLWLASSSPYRRQLLERLQLPLRCQSPAVDESARAGEAPAELAARLALAKARSIAEREPQALIIGSDQVCALDEQCLGKPGSPQAQIAMLERLSGREVCFYTAVSIVGLEARLEASHLDITRLQFRALSRRDIDSYVAAEPAYDCAGGFKCEGLGIGLLERWQSEDPTALIGLPMIFVARTLRPFYA